MNVLVDTSAYYALADADDQEHASAKRIFRMLVEGNYDLWTTSYVVLETAALVQSRLGLDALRLLRESLSTSTTVIWIDPELHDQAWDELERIGRQTVSLVDCSVGVVAGAFGIGTVFALDPHFAIWGLQPAL